MVTKVAIAGASGFVGRNLMVHLAHKGIKYRTLKRIDLEVGDIDHALMGCDAIVNCVGDKSGVEPAAQFANVTLPQRLYAAAHRVGAKQFVHVSSVAAISDVSLPGKRIDDAAVPIPQTAYGRSKLQGDVALGGMVGPILTILRPPILIGADANGVFASFRRCAMKGLPLPLGGAEGLRSFMHVENFAEAVVAAIQAGVAGAYIVTDSPPLTSEEMYRKMLAAVGRQGRIFSIGSPGRTTLRALLGRRGKSLFDHAAYDGSRFVQEAKPRWPVLPQEIIAAVMSSSERAAGYSG